MAHNLHTRQDFLVELVRNGSTIYGYFLRNRQGIFSPVLARRFGAPDTVEDMPNWMIKQGHVAPDSIGEWCRLFSAIDKGESGDAVMVSLKSDDGGFGQYLLRSNVISDENGQPFFAFISLDNFTELYKQFHAKVGDVMPVSMSPNADSQKAEEIHLREQVRQQEEKLRLSAQHSERIICHYDVKKQSSGVLEPKACIRCKLPYLCKMNTQAILKSKHFPPESMNILHEMFQNIENGKSGGEVKIQATIESGELRWFDIKYSTIYDEQNTPASAILSHKDITEEYERELAYQRYVQSIEFNAEGHLMYVESDLTADRIEKLAGQMLTTKERTANCSHSDFGRLMLNMKFQFEDVDGSSKYFSCENLLDQYARGERHLKREWQVRYSDNSLHWMDIDASLMADPYNGHVRAFFRMLDITEEKKAQLEIQQRSEQDSMTGLYNRATAEAKTRSLMTDKEPGILVLLDLDDLKGINDTFGHKEGDKAILGITRTLQSHFRESDVLGRLGGDEFLAYLPGSAENIDSISVSLTSLLRKLSGISIGKDDERRIHCSVGCAVQSPKSVTFDTLFKQADTALYHVKRNGKNNFAFYEPEMEQADYQFRTQKLLSLQSAKKFDMTELQHLLGSIASFYQMVLSVNLSSNDYYLMEEGRDDSLIGIPTFGTMDDFSRMVKFAVHPDDLDEFFEILSRRSLLATYERGEKNVRHHFRFKHQDEYRWTESVAIFYTNDQGDVCNFTLLRWADERAHELERLWLQKVMELAVNVSFEYICLLNLNSGEYSLFGNKENTHGVPIRGNFDAVTQSIRDYSIEESKREEYYENAKLSTIAARMQENGDSYSYRYTMPDGERQASFHWFEPTHTQVLMTVQRLAKL